MATLISFVEAHPNIPDLGLGYIAASLKKHRHQVIQRNGIKIGAWFMIGFPKETKKK